MQPKDADSLADTFEEVEKLYYKLHYTNFTERQNDRNAKIRHTERNRSTEDLLTSKKTCPEESIYQLGTLESHASPKELFQIATEFMDEFHERFGKHVHIQDWALHLDEGTPHIHERHVFDCENKYGEIAPQQEKALEALGFELPKPDKPLGRYNNRKITFDAACRTMLFEIAKRHGLELDEVPEYGGRAYLEKQDYIMAKQKEQLAQQEKAIQEQTAQLENLKQENEKAHHQQVRRTTYQSLTLLSNDKKIQKQEKQLSELSQKIEDTENLLDEISAVAYDKAVAIVSENAVSDALKASTEQVDIYLDWLKEPGRTASKETLDYTTYQITSLRKNIIAAVNRITARLTTVLIKPEIKKPAIEQIKENTRPSVLQKLHRRQEEIKKSSEQTTGVRHALTIPQQRAFMEHIANHPVYCHWWPLFTVLLGTGCRIGEALGLRWDDLDYERRTISINHSLVYYPVGESRNSVLHISKPKTEAGVRTIPMFDTVKDAFEMLHEEQKESGWNDVEIDGMSGFIFCNRFGNVPNPQSVNRAIKRIIADYNAGEEVEAKKQHREAVLLPDFSAHHLRHTFCTRLCEKETNLKVIQSVMGHKDIQTTMDIYAEATEEKKQESFERLAATLDIF